MIAHTGNGSVTFTAPIAFQDTPSGERVAVEVAYQLLSAPDGARLKPDVGPGPTALAANEAQYGFTLGNYDPTLPLVIDPLLQSSYLGGTGSDGANALAIHPASGEVLIAGSTSSTDLPSITLASGGVATGEQSVKSTGVDAFVSRLSFDPAAGDLVPNGFAFASRLNVPLSSVQTSDSAQITGVLGNVPVSINGGSFAAFCVSSSAGCGCNVQPFTSVAGTINNNQYVCVRQVAPASPPTQTKATLVVGGGWADFIVSTGTQITSCNLDIDGSGGAPNAVSDGLMLVRAMLGFTGTNVTNGAIIGTPPRNTWALIRDYLNQNCGTNFAP